MITKLSGCVAVIWSTILLMYVYLDSKSVLRSCVLCE